MRAVNLVPSEARSGGVTGGKSGGAVYGFLGGLVVLMIALSALAMAHRDKAQAEQELAQVQQSTQSYQQLAQHYSSFTTAAQQTSQRIELVRSIAQARFDWAGALRELSRLIPANTQINNLAASVKAGVGGSDSGKLRGALADMPAITLEGCSVNQATVADLVTRLQAMRRVQNVSLESSSTSDDIKSDSASGSSQGASGTTDTSGGCSLKDPSYTFTVTVFYAPGNAKPASDAGTTTGATDAASVAGTTPAGTN